MTDQSRSGYRSIGRPQPRARVPRTSDLPKPMTKLGGTSLQHRGTLRRLPNGTAIWRAVVPGSILVCSHTRYYRQNESCQVPNCLSTGMHKVPNCLSTQMLLYRLTKPVRLMVKGAATEGKI